MVAYSRLRKAQSNREKPGSRRRSDDSSGDELAETALLYNVPSLPGHQPIRLPSLHSFGAIATEDILRPHTSRSDQANTEGFDKPLPPIPLEDHVAPLPEQKQHSKTRPALGIKTTNMRAPFSPGRQSLKPSISSPLHLSQPNTSTLNISRPNTSYTIQSPMISPNTAAGAADLGTKISNLLEQATHQEEQTRQKAAVYEAESAKLSPLERSRIAILKATRALKAKLGQSSTSRPVIEKATNSRMSRTTRPSISPGSESAQHHKSQEDVREQLDRRVNEGRNLSNPKIRALTGNGHIRRKPLPVYESMKSRSASPILAEGACRDSSELEVYMTPEEYSSFDFDLNGHSRTNKTDLKMSSPDQSDAQVGVSRPFSDFPDHIYGQSQHPDTVFFSSPPVATSTPNVRKQHENPVTLRSLSGGELVRRHSLPDSLSESSPSKISHRPTVSDGSTLSVKRKGATHDLRSDYTPTSSSKKAKTGSNASNEDNGLNTRISQLETRDERAPLASRTINTQVESSDISGKRIRRGLTIFDVIGKGKGKEPDSREDHGIQKAQARPTSSRQSSFSRPSSMLFSRGRDSRAGMRRLHSYGGDEMDVDELQADGIVYAVGR